MPNNLDTYSQRIADGLKSDNGQMWVFLGIAGVAVGVGSFFLIRNAVRNRQSTKASEQELQNIVNEQKSSGVQATITSTTAKSIANDLYNAMASMGTNSDLIRTSFAKIKNGVDMALVNQAFGERDYGTFGAPYSSWFPSTPKNLKAWLEEEIGGSSLMKDIEAKLTEWGVSI